ncbi:MAG: alpha/beta hydrolase [Sneathiella sp.]
MNQAVLVKILSSIPDGIFNLLYAGRRIRKDGQVINAKAQLLCRIVDKQSVPLEEETVENTRLQLEQLSGMLAGPEVPLKSVENFEIPGPNGAIPVRLYKSANCPALAPVLIGFHGGGFIRGSISSHDGLFRRFASYGDFAVLSVDYSLAPEHKYPAAVDDAYAVLRWTQSNGAEKGLDTTKIAVGGDSSGGNLAAVAVQDAKRAGTPQPVFQLLLYPTTDANFDAKSHETYADGFFLTGERMRWYRDHYLPTSDARNEVRASPGLENDLSGLAPALIITAGFDPLRDEAEEYAKKLKSAGVPMGMIRYEGMVHGFMSLTGLLKDGEAAIKTSVHALQSVFNESVAP